MTSQEKYEYIAEQLDGYNSESFAWWVTSISKEDIVYNLVKDWVEAKTKRPTLLNGGKK